MEKMKKNILKYSLPVLIIISGFFSWFSVYRAIKIPGSSDWLAPILWFSSYVIFLCLASILARHEIMLEITVFASFFMSIILVFSVWHLIIVAVCAVIMLSGMRNIRNDLDLNIKISLWKSLHTGKMKMIFALAVVICSQYFFIINSTNGQKTIPKLDFSSVSTKLIEPILGMINPNFKAIQQQGLTVDQFIMESVQKNGSGSFSMPDLSLNGDFIDKQIPESMPSDQREALKQQALKQISDSQTQLSKKNNALALEEGHKQLSQLTGQDITGDEKIADVFAGLINKKINDYFQPRVDSDSRSSLFSYILVFILFLTVLPLGSLLSRLWFLVVMLIFHIFVRFALVEIKTITVEREMIA